MSQRLAAVQDDQDPGGGGVEPFRVGLARAFAGALVFSLPMLMTMEMWWLGFYLESFRIALLLILSLPLLVGLSHFIGYETTFDWREDVVDAFVALAVSFFLSAVVLTLIAILGPGVSFRVVMGTITLQTIPGAIGALLATSQLNGGTRSERRERWSDRRFRRQLFLMLVGAIFLSLNLAPTDEMVFIAYAMTPWHNLLLVVASLVVMHALISPSSFLPDARRSGGPSQLEIFAKTTAVGYAVALAASVYMLWTFGRFEGVHLAQSFEATVVLAFPAAVGAAGARLVL